MRNLKRHDTNDLICKTGTHSFREQTIVAAGKNSEGKDIEVWNG